MNDVRKKSPRAPTLALPDALDRVEKVYAEEGRHATPTEIVAQALGYKSATNGSAAQMIASLRYYGLLERPKEGYLAVSKDYETYKFSPDESQKQALIIGWLRTPTVFSALLEQYDGRLPSEAKIRFDLISMGFLPSGADAYVGVFRRSVEFARFYERAAAQSEDDLLAPPSAPEQLTAIAAVPAAAAAPSPWTVPYVAPQQAMNLAHAGTPQAMNMSHAAGIPVAPQAMNLAPAAGIAPTVHNAEVIRVPVRLSKDRMAWLELPIPFYEADKERLKLIIDTQLADDPDDA